MHAHVLYEHSSPSIKSPSSSQPLHLSQFIFFNWYFSGFGILLPVRYSPRSWQRALTSLIHGFFCSRKTLPPPGSNSYLHAKDQSHTPSENGNTSLAHHIPQVSCTQPEFPAADSSHIPPTLVIYWPVTLDSRSTTGNLMFLGGHLGSPESNLCSSGNKRESLFRCLFCATRQTGSLLKGIIRSPHSRENLHMRRDTASKSCLRLWFLKSICRDSPREINLQN